MSEQNAPDEFVSRSDKWLNLLIAAAAVAGCFFYWEQAKGILLFLLTLGVLVAVHEWGHFIAAKSVGVRVYEFALGMGPRIWTYMRKDGTDYTVRALPIGGFVNLKGMQPDEPLTSDGLNGRKPAERALVYLAGPLMNVILCVAILCLTPWLVGTPDESKVIVGDVKPKLASHGPSPAAQMRAITKNGQPATAKDRGLRTGDRILEVNGAPVASLYDVVDVIHASVGKPVTLRVQRHGNDLVLEGVPERGEQEANWLVVRSAPAVPNAVAVQPGDQLDQIDGKDIERLAGKKETPEAAAQRLLRERDGKPITLTVWRNGETRLELSGTATPLDVAASATPVKRYWGMFGFGPTAGQGPTLGFGPSVQQGYNNMVALLLGFQHLFSHPKNLGNNVGGTIAIWDAVAKATDLPPYQYFWILAQISFSLAAFNLLPIFMLDGGHVLILTLEVLRRKRLEPEAQRVAAVIGIIIIGVLFIVVNFNDIWKRFG